jgi:hypothetical protein
MPRPWREPEMPHEERTASFEQSGDAIAFDIDAITVLD